MNIPFGNIATGLDHAGIVVPDLGAAALEWQRLGFAPTALARHEAAGPDGVIGPTGTGNRCIMLGQGYLELIAVVDPSRGSATLARFLARHTGIHILTLATPDAEAALHRLRRAGLDTELITSARAADPEAPTGAQARFKRLAITTAVPRLQLLQHLTPELVWQPRFLRHPNHAVALEAIIVASDAPAELAAMLSRVAGVAMVADPLGGYALVLGQGAVRVVPPDAARAMLPGVDIRCSPFAASLVLRTDDGNRAVAALAQARPVGDGHLLTATGTAVLFRPAGGLAVGNTNRNDQVP